MLLRAAGSTSPTSSRVRVSVQDEGAWCRSVPTAPAPSAVHSTFGMVSVSSLRLRSTEHRTPVPAQDSVSSTGLRSSTGTPFPAQDSGSSIGLRSSLKKAGPKFRLPTVEKSRISQSAASKNEAADGENHGATCNNGRKLREHGATCNRWQKA